MKNTQMPERAVNLMGGLLFFAVLITACLFVGYAFKTGGFSGIYAFLAALVFALAAGALFVRLYLPALADGIVHTLLWPMRFLKKPRAALSPVYAMIEKNEFDEAEQALKDLIAEDPENTEITLVLFELYLDKMNRRDDAVELAELFFKGTQDREVSPCNLKMLMRYADCAMECGRFDILIAILKKELSESVYSVPDKSAISCRLIAVQRLQER